MPPLRDRPGDVPLLAAHFLAELNRLNPGLGHAFASETLRILDAHLWPGNVRELANAIEHAFAVTDDTLLGPEDLPAYLASRPADAAPEEGVPYQEARRRSLLAFERAYLEHLLGRCEGNVSRAARKAGLHRSALQRLLRRHGLLSEAFRRPEHP